MKRYLQVVVTMITEIQNGWGLSRINKSRHETRMHDTRWTHVSHIRVFVSKSLKEFYSLDANTW